MSGLSSLYPPPPHFYKHFTDENVKKVKDLTGNSKGEAKEADSETLPDAPAPGAPDSENLPDAPATAADANADFSASNMPDDLVYLLPPKPPQSYYRMFGNIWDPSKSDLQSLEEAGIKQLYSPLNSSSDRIYELKKLLKSLLVSFLELVGIMSIAPEQFPAKTEDLRIILINMHHILNEYRPHQSRESLVLLMEEQIAAKRKEIETLQTTSQSIRDRVKNLAVQLSKELASQGEPAVIDSDNSHLRADISAIVADLKPRQDDSKAQAIRRRDLNLWELAREAER